MNSRLFRCSALHQKLARPMTAFGPTSTRPLSFSRSRSMNDEEKSLKDRVKISRPNEDYMTLPNWVPFVAFLLLFYKVYEHAIEYSLALKQLECLSRQTADKLEMIDRKNEIAKIQQDVAIARSIDEVIHCKNEIGKVAMSLHDGEKQWNKEMEILESQNRNQDEIKRNMRTLFDAIQRLNQNQKVGSTSSAAKTPNKTTNSNASNSSWFEIQRNIKTNLKSSPQERFLY